MEQEQRRWSYNKQIGQNQQNQILCLQKVVPDSEKTFTPYLPQGTRLYENASLHNIVYRVVDPRPLASQLNPLPLCVESQALHRMEDNIKELLRGWSESGLSRAWGPQREALYAEAKALEEKERAKAAGML